jgi:hypothetical protein
VAEAAEAGLEGEEAMSENTITLKVDGVDVTLDIGADTAIDVENVSGVMERIAALIAWYGRVLAAAVRSRDIADDDYRHWRAVFARDHVANNPKDAEHKVKSAIESDRKFIAYKRAIRDRGEIALRLQKAVDALEIKAEILRSIGANLREEFRATGLNTPTKETVDERRERRAQAAREARKDTERRRATRDEDDDNEGSED